MRQRVYRCYCCRDEKGAFGRDFEVRLEDSHPTVKLTDNTVGEAVACPSCGMSNTHAALGGNVVPLAVIHFEPPITKAMHGRAGRGTIACDPKTKTVGTVGLVCSGEPLVVNCPLCRETAEFREQSGGGLHPSFDIQLPTDDKGIPLVPELHEYKKPADPARPPE